MFLRILSIISATPTATTFINFIPKGCELKWIILTSK